MDPSPPQADGPNALDYSPPLRFRQRRFLRRILIAVILITAIAFSVAQIRSHWPELHLYYLQHECLAHPIPAGTLVYRSGTPQVIQSAEVAQLFAAYGHAPTPIYGTHMQQNSGPAPYSFTTATVYVGKRGTTNGGMRFLAITACVDLWNGNETSVGFHVLNSPTAFSQNPYDLPADQIPTPNDLPIRRNAKVIPHVQIYAATEDPTDPSHLTFIYDYDVWHCTIDCRVQPGGLLRIGRREQLWTIAPNGTRVPPLIEWPGH